MNKVGVDSSRATKVSNFIVHSYYKMEYIINHQRMNISIYKYKGRFMNNKYLLYIYIYNEIKVCTYQVVCAFKINSKHYIIFQPCER